MKREQLFTDLEAPSEEQIEVGLEAGEWGDPARAAVQRNLDQLRLARVEVAASEAARAAIQAALVASEEASTSKLRATVALITRWGNGSCDGGSLRRLSGSAKLDLVTLQRARTLTRAGEKHIIDKGDRP